MRRRLTTILATTLLASGIAAAQEPTGSPPEPAGLLSGATVSCSLAAPSWVAGCWLERAVLTLGPLEVAVGVDAQAALAGSLDEAHLAPYGIVALYLDSWSAWLEVRLPRIASVPLLGSPDVARLGFTYRIP